MFAQNRRKKLYFHKINDYYFSPLIYFAYEKVSTFFLPKFNYSVSCVLNPSI